jgi:phosphoesterase RecJ-like protein
MAERPPAAERLYLAAERIAAASAVLLTCHRRPDGDSVGSLVALASLLRQQGKRVTLYNPDLVPRRLKWMPLARAFTRKLGAGACYQVTVVADCAEVTLLGRSFPGPAVTGEVVVLDHHGSGRSFGDVYVCDPDAASVGVLVARMARYLGWPMGTEAAEGIYVSLLSDTGSFRYANTNAEALRLAADLVECGVDPWKVSERLFERSSMQRYRLLRAALGTLDSRLGGKVVFMTITKEMVKACGATWDDSVDLVSYTRALDGVACGVLLTPARQ